MQRTIRHVDVWSVFKLSIFYYACFTVLWLLLVAVLYGLLAQAGLFDAIEKFGKSMVLWDKVDISLIYVEKWALLLAIAFLIIGSLTSTLPVLIRAVTTMPVMPMFLSLLQLPSVDCILRR